MSTFLTAFRRLRQDLSAVYEGSESNAVARQFLEAVSKKTYSALLADDTAMKTEDLQAWQEKASDLLQGKPLQQVLGYGWFLNRKFLVNEHTLIPRPETEELVNWIVAGWKDKEAFTLLDVGTGTGCMAVSLSLALPHAKVTAIDISENALAVAIQNNAAWNATVSFLQMDFLKQKEALPFFDLIVSNPPYIPFAEKEKMDKNVREYEPQTALFVPDDDPLMFYRQLAIFGNRSAASPVIYCELHQALGKETENLFREYGYNTLLRQDMFGNDRMLKAEKPHGT